MKLEIKQIMCLIFGILISSVIFFISAYVILEYKILPKGNDTLSFIIQGSMMFICGLCILLPSLLAINFSDQYASKIRKLNRKNK